MNLTDKLLRKYPQPEGQKAPFFLRGFKREHLVQRLAQEGLTKGAEVGVSDGRFSEYMCQTIPGLNLLCVDPWLTYGADPRSRTKYGTQDEHYETSRRKLAQYNATLVRRFSMDAVQAVPENSLDYVFIDGNHCFDYVMQDIIEWAKRVRRGGIVSGHDYYEFRWAGVVQAVNAYTRAHGIERWFVTDEKEKTWFWEKQ